VKRTKQTRPATPSKKTSSTSAPCNNPQDRRLRPILHLPYMHIPILNIAQLRTTRLSVPPNPQPFGCRPSLRQDGYLPSLLILSHRSKTAHPAPLYFPPPHFSASLRETIFSTTKPHRVPQAPRTHFPPACTHVHFFQRFNASHSHQRSVCSPLTSFKCSAGVLACPKRAQRARASRLPFSTRSSPPAHSRSGGVPPPSLRSQKR